MFKFKNLLIGLVVWLVGLNFFVELVFCLWSFKNYFGKYIWVFIGWFFKIVNVSKIIIEVIILIYVDVIIFRVFLVIDILFREILI